MVIHESVDVHFCKNSYCNLSIYLAFKFKFLFEHPLYDIALFCAIELWLNHTVLKDAVLGVFVLPPLSVSLYSLVVPGKLIQFLRQCIDLPSLSDTFEIFNWVRSRTW